MIHTDMVNVRFPEELVKQGRQRADLLNMTFSCYLRTLVERDVANSPVLSEKSNPVVSTSLLAEL